MCKKKRKTADRIDPFIVTSVLLSCTANFGEVEFSRQLNDVLKTINVTSYITKLCHFAF